MGRPWQSDRGGKGKAEAGARMHRFQGCDAARRAEQYPRAHGEQRRVGVPEKRLHLDAGGKELPQPPGDFC